jgi:hypothetical protein
MFLWVISISCVSLLFIFIIHQLILFFKSTLTVPKVKDFIHSPHEKYKHIYDTISSSSTNSSIGSGLSGGLTSGLGKYNDASIIPNIDTSNPYDSSGADTIGASMINNGGVSSSQNKDMKSELKNFLKKQLQNR